MSGSYVIRAEGLAKHYRIGSMRQAYGTLRDSVSHAVRRALGREAPAAASQELWALRDLSFAVRPGEVLGVIGRNGAGKSTLLKILARITPPTAGRIEVRGRIGTLLEVGTGFHPELSGRENIFLNGAILGMSRAEIKARFDEIVAFAEIEKFLDTPVKRYSSGMYVRLAFAVAAHLETEILLVDEVLAVGDAAFQKKCLGKMGEVAQGGRTVLFVSHNMAAIGQLSSQCLYIDQGKNVRHGKTDEVIADYMRSHLVVGDENKKCFAADPAKDFQLLAAIVVNGEGRSTKNFNCDEPIVLQFYCRANRSLPGLYGYLSLSRLDGTIALISDTFDAGPNPLDSLPIGHYRVAIALPPRTLAPGDYFVYFNFTSEQSEKGFQVDSPGIVGSFRLDDYRTARGNLRQGFFSTILKWEVASVTETDGQEFVAALETNQGNP